MCTTTAGMALLTVTCTPGEVATFPATSVARAAIVWEPLGVVAVFQLAEYGAVGFGLYLLLITSAERTERQRLLVPPMLVLLLFTGGYHQVAPLLFPTLLIITTARLQDASASPARSRPGAAPG